MKNFLFVCSKYHTEKDNPYLTNDIVNEVCARGNNASIISLGSVDLETDNGLLTEKIISLSSNIKYLKYIFTWWKLYLNTRHAIRRIGIVDHVVFFAPLIVMWPAVLALKLNSSKIVKSTAVVFDLFPIHQQQIGAVPGILGGILKYVETRLLKVFDVVTAMGPRNKLAIREYYFDGKPFPEVRIVPLWLRSDSCKKLGKLGKPNPTITCVFGGQIVKGRDTDALIEHFSSLRNFGIDLRIDFYSSGPSYAELSNKYATLSWLSFHSQIPRKDYIEVISKYDVGLIVTDARVTLPTFPSKVLDYLAAGISVYAIVEPKSDLKTLGDMSDLIHLNFFDFSDARIFESLSFFNSLKSHYTQEELSNYEKVRGYLSLNRSVSELIR